MPHRKEITADYDPGTVEDIVQHDGSVIRLHKLDNDYNPYDRIAAMNYLQAHAARAERSPLPSRHRCGTPELTWRKGVVSGCCYA